MTKTYKELMEEITSINPTGTLPDGVSKGMDSYTIDHMKKFCEQISHAFQPEMPQLLRMIETELNKFGFTLGNIDMEDDEESDGEEEDFLIYTKSTKEMVDNVYMCMDWERLASGQQAKYRHDGAKLVLDVKLKMEKTTPEELKAMLGDMDNKDLDDKVAPTDDGQSLHND